jgi:hypothetical protein
VNPVLLISNSTTLADHDPHAANAQARLGACGYELTSIHRARDPWRAIDEAETQEQRIRRFHEEATTPVAGLREGAMVACDAGRSSLRGVAAARLFRRGRTSQSRGRRSRT